MGIVVHSYAFVGAPPMDTRTSLYDQKVTGSVAMVAHRLEKTIKSNGHKVNSHVRHTTLNGIVRSVFFLVDVNLTEETMWHLVTEPTEPWPL